jgi:hypothetical protein
LEPRSARRREGLAVVISLPCSLIEPLAIRSPAGTAPITAEESTDLPEPDSPTTQTISRLWTSMLAPSTA